MTREERELSIKYLEDIKENFMEGEGYEIAPLPEYYAIENAIKSLKQEPRKGEWLRMSDLSEQEDDRYKCSRCGNVIHHKSKMDLYTFNSWCGRCGSDNGRHINYEVEEMTKEEAKEFIARSIKSDVDMAKVADAIKALEEPEWIPMVRREPTEEEKTEYLAQNGEELCYMLENEMPLHGQEVLVSIGEFVEGDIFDADFYNFENNDIENVDAWMPRPKPYKAESEE